jgi:hypothetical protein
MEFESSQALPRYVVFQYRVDEDTKRARMYALTTTKADAKRAVIRASRKRRQDNEFYIVVDGPKTARDPEDNTHFVGASCHASKEVVLMKGEDHPILMPVEIAKMYEGDENVVAFMTQNRNRPPVPALKSPDWGVTHLKMTDTEPKKKEGDG